VAEIRARAPRDATPMQLSPASNRRTPSAWSRAAKWARPTLARRTSSMSASRRINSDRKATFRWRLRTAMRLPFAFRPASLRRPQADGGFHIPVRSTHLIWPHRRCLFGMRRVRVAGPQSGRRPSSTTKCKRSATQKRTGPRRCQRYKWRRVAKCPIHGAET
jgi:hypothetical protein